MRFCRWIDLLSDCQCEARGVLQRSARASQRQIVGLRLVNRKSEPEVPQPDIPMVSSTTATANSKTQLVCFYINHLCAAADIDTGRRNGISGTDRQTRQAERNVPHES